MNFSVLTWNIQGTKYYTSTNFKKILPELNKIRADIFCLQEAQEILQQKNNIKELASYNIVSLDENANGADVILSRFKIVSSGVLNLPSSNKKGAYKIIWAEVETGEGVAKVYNCHLEIIGVGPKERAEQLVHILNDSKSHHGPVIVCGDFNTTIPAAGVKRRIVRWFHKEPLNSLIEDNFYKNKDERYNFVDIAKEKGFSEAADISESTWCILPFKWKIFRLKLDWILSRGIQTTNVKLGKFISDHKSIFVECSII